MSARAATPKLDQVTVGIWLLVMMLSVVAVASASLATAEDLYGDSLHLLWRHIAYVAGALVTFVIVLSLPISIWRRMYLPVLLALVVVLSAVLVPGVGHKVNGATRWIDLGPATFQVSEAARFLSLIVFAGFLAKHRARIQESFVPVAVLLTILCLVCGLLLLEPDFGTAAVLALTCLLMLFLAGARILHMVALGVVGVAAAAALIMAEKYRLDRVLSFFRPFEDADGDGYQLGNSLIAIGRGEWHGLGLGDGIQKLLYLPEAHNDFLFAIIAEETGAIGAMIVMAILLLICWRVFQIGRRADAADEPFGALLCYGIAGLICIQTLVHVGVNLGLLPTKGLTLPFVSYGGNSLLVSAALLALAMRVHWQIQIPARVRARASRQESGR